MYEGNENVSNRVIRVGVIGCGMIAQTMHLPYLKRLPHFEIVAMCDLSPGLVNQVADSYGVTKRYTDHHQLLAQTDVEAVFIATRDHAPVAIDAANAGKHVMSEKPIAFTLEDADKVIAAAKANNVKLMIAYMKRYDPGYEWAQSRFKQMKDIRLIRSHDFAGAFGMNSSLFDLMGANDLSEAVLKDGQAKMDADLVQAIGQDRAHMANAYSSLLHLSTHDSTILRGAFGEPESVEYADIYGKGQTVAVLRYGNNTRCMWEMGVSSDRVPWDEHLVAYGSEQTIRLQFPYPWLHNAATTVHVTEKEDGAFIEKQVSASFDEAFRREWIHFHKCVTEDLTPITNGEEARGDVKLMIDIVKAVRI